MSITVRYFFPAIGLELNKYKNRFLPFIYKLLLNSKFDTLRQVKFLAKVNRISLPAHIIFPAIRTRFPASSCLFFASKCTTNLCTGSSDIYIGYPTVRALV